MSDGVSVIIPAYNAEGTIGETIRSVIAQEYPGELEIVIVDDASGDRTLEVAETALRCGSGFKACLVPLAMHEGLGYARNVGLGLASHEYVLPVDADDQLIGPEWWPEGRGFLDLGVEALRGDPSVDVVFCDIQSFGAMDEVHVLDEFDPELFLEYCTIWTPGMHRRSTALAMGGYDITLKCANDFAYWAKMLEYKERKGEEIRAVKLPGVFYLYRRYPIGGKNPHCSRESAHDHRLGWRLLIERFPELYTKYFPGVRLEDLAEVFYQHELARRRGVGTESRSDRE